MPDLHSRIKRNRIRLGLSQKDLALKCGVSQPTVANWERGGHIPRQDALRKIAENLGVDSVWLLSGELPGHQTPAFQYLNSPIRHIAVYQWEKEAEKLSKANPIRYTSIATECTDVFGIIAPREGQFSQDTILIFDRGASLAANTRFLVKNGTQLQISHASEIEGTRLTPIARLIYSITTH